MDVDDLIVADVVGGFVDALAIGTVFERLGTVLDVGGTVDDYGCEPALAACCGDGVEVDRTGGVHLDVSPR